MGQRGRPPGTEAKAKILDYARQLFATKGFAGTSVREIVGTLGLNVSLVNYHFGSKENLYRACLVDSAERQGQVAARLLVDCRSQEEFVSGLSKFIDAYLLSYAESPEAFALLSREMDQRSALFFELLQSNYLRTIERLTQFMLRGQSLGVVDPDLDPQRLSHMLFSILAGEIRSEPFKVSLLAYSISDEEERQRVVGHCLRLLTNRTPPNEAGSDR